MQSKGALADLVVLAAEANFAQGVRPRAAKVAVDYDVLRAAAGPVGLAVRISPYAGPFNREQPETQFLAALIREVRDEARRNRVEPTMIQIDFDAAVSKLGGYQQWLMLLREEVAPTPLVITALPAWLGSPAFAKLVQEVDAYVLQVHAPDAKLLPNTTPTVCNPKQAEAAISQAAALGHPFFVALPTYGYRAWYNEKGSPLYLAAEGQSLMADDRLPSREVRADPAAMARLVQRLAAKRPARMKGIIWYRLPHPDDQMNWSWTTLQAVMQGREPQSETDVHLDRPQAGLVEVSLIAKGEADSLFADTVILDWRNNASLLAADGMAGFVCERAGPESLRLSFRGSKPFRLAPGRRQMIGWLSFDHPTEISTHVEALHL